MADKPIFHDASGRRAAWLSLIGWAAAIVSTLVGVAFIMNLMAVPRVQTMRLPGQLTAIQTREVLEKKAKAPGLVRMAEALAQRAWLRRAKLATLRRTRNERRMRAHPLSSAMRPAAGRPLSIAFYPDWSEAAFPALKHALPRLDAVMPTWLNLHGPDLALDEHFNRPGLWLYPPQQAGHRDPAGAAERGHGHMERAGAGQASGRSGAADRADRSAGAIRRAASAAGRDHRLRRGARQRARATWRSSSAPCMRALPRTAGPWRRPRPSTTTAGPSRFMRRSVDYTVLMAYDQHMAADPAGPIAGESWYEHELDKRMRVLAPSRTIIALGGYGYDWNGSDVDSLTFEDAVVGAHDSGADVDFDAASDNPHFSYREEDGTLHNVWFLDAATAFNEIHAADIYQPAGYALWRLGSEDPSVWDVMHRAYGAGCAEKPDPDPDQ